MDQILDKPTLKMNEIGVLSKNAALFDMRDDKINELYRFGSHEVLFGFFDGISDKTKLNALILHYIELLMHLHKHDSYFVIFKDFLAKRIARFPKSVGNLIIHAKLVNFKSENRKLGNIPESNFNLKELMDEKELATQAVDLNLKLMRWRQLETLDLDLLHNIRVLLLGAGTLGCQLARNLAGWGIKNFTFVDYGKVNHSNPVRQSLYCYEDVVKGRQKAEAAAEQMTKIMPSINAKGYSLQIPMPGHGFDPKEADKLAADTDLLDKLVQEHDAVFLLLDTREARWLPTVMSASHDKVHHSLTLDLL